MANTEPRTKKDGTVIPGAAAKPATLNTYVAVVKSFLNLAHDVGFTPFNAAPLVRIKAAPPRLLAQKIMGDVDVTLLFRSARTKRDRLMMRVAYYDGLRVSDLVMLTWAQVIPRDSG